MDWWVEITTVEPRCLYGSFQTPQEAEESSPGYVEDLEAEQTKDIQTIVKRCQLLIRQDYEDLARS